MKVRFLPLDALRGISIFLMILSSAIPFGVLPAWMYHAQVPPPGHLFDPQIPGITWVDLVFPFFLFTMGVAIPFALQRKRDRGEPSVRIILRLAGRGLLLAAFAIFDEHIRPHRLSATPDTMTWLLSLLGFVLLFPMFGARPPFLSRRLWRMLQAGGWVGAAIFMASITYPDGTGFLVARRDIIILVLAYMAVAGGIVWLAARGSELVRWGVLGVYLALRLSAPSEGWVHELWSATFDPALFQFHFLKYLFIVVPGTIVGDRLLRWMAYDAAERVRTEWSSSRYAGIVAILSSLVVITVVGLYARLLFETVVFVFVLLGVFLNVVPSSRTPFEITLRGILNLGWYLLVLGLCLEAFEGGIRKDDSTLSYYAVTTGLAVFALGIVWVMMDVWKVARPFRTLIGGGQNPLVAYSAINNFTRPLLGLTSIGPILSSAFSTPWMGVVLGVIITWFTLWLAALCTRAKILLKT